jgi:hypothetical protein
MSTVSLFDEDKKWVFYSLCVFANRYTTVILWCRGPKVMTGRIQNVVIPQSTTEPLFISIAPREHCSEKNIAV